MRRRVIETVRKPASTTKKWRGAMGNWGKGEKGDVDAKGAAAT